MWMLTPTLRGVNLAAIREEHTNKIKSAAQWSDEQGNKAWKCLEKQIGTMNGLPFMDMDIN